MGDGWGSAAFPLNGDSWTAEDSPHIPDLARPAVTLRSFDTTTGSVEYDHVNAMDFSDDGKYLAVCSDQGRVWVYDTADWSEVVHTHAGGSLPARASALTRRRTPHHPEPSERGRLRPARRRARALPPHLPRR
ncbi:hypothetical protein AB0D24_34830 [Streptomyces javensis]|uniref:hypothetical protein n=1 Tax=Streptomyces javensis TaxID=114698 RepID=UPI0033EAECEC